MWSSHRKKVINKNKLSISKINNILILSQTIGSKCYLFMSRCNNVLCLISALKCENMLQASLRLNRLKEFWWNGKFKRKMVVIKCKSLSFICLFYSVVWKIIFTYSNSLINGLWFIPLLTEFKILVTSTNFPTQIWTTSFIILGKLHCFMNHSHDSIQFTFTGAEIKELKSLFSIRVHH